MEMFLLPSAGGAAGLLPVDMRAVWTRVPCPEGSGAGRVMCRQCGNLMLFIHGHYACIVPECPLKGQPQEPCCEGDC